MLLVPPLACLPPHPVDRSGPSWCVLDSTHPETLLKTARIQSRTHRYPSTHARRGPSNRNPFHPPAGIMTADDGGSCASGGRDGTAATAAALTAADDLPPPMTGQALDEHAARAWQFYRETLGSPKHVCAPMVRVCVCVCMDAGDTIASDIVTGARSLSQSPNAPDGRANTPTHRWTSRSSPSASSAGATGRTSATRPWSTRAASSRRNARTATRCTTATPRRRTAPPSRR